MAQLNFRVDDKLKARAENICMSMGLTISSAINIFLTKLVNEKRIPFDVSVESFYSESNIAELERRIADLESGKSTLKEHDLIEVD